MYNLSICFHIKLSQIKVRLTTNLNIAKDKKYISKKR